MKTRIKAIELNNGINIYTAQYKKSKIDTEMSPAFIVLFPLMMIGFLFLFFEFLLGNFKAFCPYEWEQIGDTTKSLPEAKNKIDQFLVGCLISKLQTEAAEKKETLLKTKKTTYIKYP